MSKRKKIIIIIAVAVSILCMAGTGAYMWYRDSPFPTVINFMKAVREKDMDGMLDCIEPDKARMIKWIFSAIGLDMGDLMDRIMPEGEELFQNAGASGMKFSAYHQEGDEAYIEFAVEGEEGETEQTRRIDFIRIDGKWYLELSFSPGR